MSTAIDSSKEINDKDIVRISEYKKSEYQNISGYTPDWSENVFVMKKVKKTVRWTYVVSDLNGEEIVGTFYEKELQ